MANLPAVIVRNLIQQATIAILRKLIQLLIVIPAVIVRNHIQLLIVIPAVIVRNLIQMTVIKTCSCCCKMLPANAPSGTRLTYLRTYLLVVGCCCHSVAVVCWSLLLLLIS